MLNCYCPRAASSASQPRAFSSSPSTGSRTIHAFKRSSNLADHSSALLEHLARCRSPIQIILLQNHWLPLFILSLLQCSSTINLANILTALLASNSRTLHRSSRPSVRCPLEKLVNNESNKWLELRRIQSLLYEFDRLHVTDIEYAYLKLISVLNPSNNTGKQPRTRPLGIHSQCT